MLQSGLRRSKSSLGSQWVLCWKQRNFPLLPGHLQEKTGIRSHAGAHGMPGAVPATLACSERASLLLGMGQSWELRA